VFNVGRALFNVLLMRCIFEVQMAK